MNFKIYLWSSSKGQVEKEGRIEIQKIEYLQDEKSFLEEIKSIFHSFWRAIMWWKNKNLMKIADTNFKKHGFYQDHTKSFTVYTDCGSKWYNHSGRRRFFYAEGMSKNVGLHGRPATKNNKKTLAKTPKSSP